LQCDNGAEFKGVFLILLKKYGIKIIYGRRKHPQTQGLVEKANGVMKVKLRCWLANHGGQGWSDALPDIALGMNRQSHSSLGGICHVRYFLIGSLYGKTELLWVQMCKLIRLSTRL